MSKVRSFIPDHLAELLGETISALTRTGPLRDLLGAFSAPIQQFEELLFGVALAGSPESASGRDLDLLGGLIGEFRGGLTDSEYRRVIQAAVWAARSKGTREEILGIFRLLVGEEGDVEYFDRYPANVELVYLRQASLTTLYKARVAAIVNRALPLGVGAEFASVDLTGGFQFGGLDPGPPGEVVGSQFGGLDPGDVAGDEFGGRW